MARYTSSEVTHWVRDGPRFPEQPRRALDLIAVDPARRRDDLGGVAPAILRDELEGGPASDLPSRRADLVLAEELWLGAVPLVAAERRVVDERTPHRRVPGHIPLRAAFG